MMKSGNIVVKSGDGTKCSVQKAKISTIFSIEGRPEKERLELFDLIRKGKGGKTKAQRF